MASKYPDYPPNLSKDQEHHVVAVVKQWSISHGLAVRPAPSFIPPEQDTNSALVTTAPVTLFPSLFPRSCFQEALEIQQAYNEMYARVATDEKFLEDVVNAIGHIDDYIANLWDVHAQVKNEGYAQTLSLGIFRSDYMVHLPTDSVNGLQLRQVEFNTIASSFGGLANRVSSLHRYLLDSKSYPTAAEPIVSANALPSNATIGSIAAGIASAFKAYGPPKNDEQRDKCVLFVVQDDERNVYDQKHIEHTLLAEHGILVFRLPWTRILFDTKLDERRTLLFYPPSFPSRAYEAAVVYFRAGYSPNEYVNRDSWKARLHLERSASIKCPTVLTHLAGSKKIQQILATPNSSWLGKFLPNEALAQRVLSTFAPMYPLDDSDAGKQGQALALNPETAMHHVLKPQREGGGNNIYRSAIPGFLSGMQRDKWPQFVLMEMIETPSQRNYILRNGELHSGGVICELGIYGTCMWESGAGAAFGNGKQQVLVNEKAGYLLRTKGDTSEEGGVAAGFGAVDSCCLIDVL